MSYCHKMWFCERCAGSVNVTPECHEFLVHHRKRKALRCPACEYGTVVRDFFEHHINSEHPEIHFFWLDYLSDVPPFMKMLPCTVDVCGFTAVGQDSLEHHRETRHGLVHDLRGKPHAQLCQWVPIHKMQMTLGQLARKEGMPLAGWNEGLRRMSILLSERPTTGLYFASHGFFHVGTLSIVDVDSGEDNGPNEGIPCRWPRCRALLINTEVKPWTVACTLTTEIDLKPAQYTLYPQLPGGSGRLTMLVNDPKFDWQGGPPPSPH